jgi:hypothetical protein
MDLAAFPWVILVVGGTIVLGLVIAWGAWRTGRRTPAEKAIRDAGTREVYKRE